MSKPHWNPNYLIPSGPAVNPQNPEHTWNQKVEIRQATKEINLIAVETADQLRKFKKMGITDTGSLEHFNQLVRQLI